MSVINQLFIICPLVFFAGFVDSIAGGGGVISLPAYFVAGVPPHMAMGTNKFASTCGTAASAWRFMKRGKVQLHSAGVAVVMALIGSHFGARMALLMDELFLKTILVIILPIVAVFILKNKNFNNDGFEKPLSRSKALLLSAVSGLAIGGYDGFFGPGTGTFLIVIFNTVIGFDILTSSGNAKMVNLASNLAALVTFLMSGSVLFTLALPAAACGIIGNYVGAGLALKNGMKAIRPMLIVVMILLLAKVCFDVISLLI